MTKLKNNKGFSLIELMIVVAIVGLLSAIAYPAYDNYVKRSKRVVAEGDLYALRNAMQRYFSENNTYLGAAASANEFLAVFKFCIPSLSALSSAKANCC